jgi:hypothetical protein
MNKGFDLRMYCTMYVLCSSFDNKELYKYSRREPELGLESLATRDHRF